MVRNTTFAPALAGARGKAEGKRTGEKESGNGLSAAGDDDRGDRSWHDDGLFPFHAQICISNLFSRGVWNVGRSEQRQTEQDQQDADDSHQQDFYSVHL